MHFFTCCIGRAFFQCFDTLQQGKNRDDYFVKLTNFCTSPLSSASLVGFSRSSGSTLHRESAQSARASAGTTSTAAVIPRLRRNHTAGAGAMDFTAFGCDSRLAMAASMGWSVAFWKNVYPGEGLTSKQYHPPSGVQRRSMPAT